jgi:hypothetical protein
MLFPVATEWPNISLGAPTLPFLRCQQSSPLGPWYLSVMRTSFARSLTLARESATMSKRRHFKQTTTLKDRLTSFAKEAREKAAQLGPCPAKDELLEKARHADTTADLADLADSPGRQPPT